jgi:hypothetical protein
VRSARPGHGSGVGWRAVAGIAVADQTQGAAVAPCRPPVEKARIWQTHCGRPALPPCSQVMTDQGADRATRECGKAAARTLVEEAWRAAAAGAAREHGLRRLYICRQLQDMGDELEVRGRGLQGAPTGSMGRGHRRRSPSAAQRAHASQLRGGRRWRGPGKAGGTGRKHRLDRGLAGAACEVERSPSPASLPPPAFPRRTRPACCRTACRRCWLRWLTPRLRCYGTSGEAGVN